MLKNKQELEQKNNEEAAISCRLAREGMDMESLRFSLRSAGSRCHGIPLEMRVIALVVRWGGHHFPYEAPKEWQTLHKLSIR